MAVLTISKYRVYFYGTKEGYMNLRGQIICFNNAGAQIAFIRFHDPDMPYGTDKEYNGKVYLHLPSDQFQNVVDVLRNEKPVYIYFAQNRGFLSTSNEPVGEEET